MKKEQDIDNIFKHSLADPVDEPVFRDNDWDAFEQMLDSKKKPRDVVYWLPILGSVAAAILIAFGWIMFKPQVINQAQNTQQTAANKKQAVQQPAITGQSTKTQSQIALAKLTATNTDKEVAETQSSTVSKTTTLTPEQVQSKSTHKEYLASNTGVKHNNGSSKVPAGQQSNVLQNDGNVVSEKIGADHAPISDTRDMNTLAAVGTTGVSPGNYMTMPTVASVDILPKATVNGVTSQGTYKNVKDAIKKTAISAAFRPQYTLSVLGSSELNGVNSLAKTSSGFNYGLLFSAELVKKFTITTGVNYSVKPYSLPFSDYNTTYTFKNTPESVSADCRVLDIPINIGYRVYGSARNKITIGTGLSSYIMMHESYTYNYGNTTTLYGPSYYAVKPHGKYLFSIMNLEASYQHQINSKVGISLQPYLKVPLSNIGYSQVKVETAGVAVGLNWNINSLTKPK